jgi:hypothetical protein
MRQSSISSVRVTLFVGLLDVSLLLHGSLSVLRYYRKFCCPVGRLPFTLQYTTLCVALHQAPYVLTLPDAGRVNLAVNACRVQNPSVRMGHVLAT